MRWLVHEAIIGDRQVELDAAVRRLGDTLYLVNGRNPELPVLSDMPTACLVTVQMARRLFFKDTPVGLFWSPSAYNTLSYTTSFSRWMLNNDMVWLPWAEFVRRGPGVWARSSTEGKIFVRPDSGQKIFPGQTISFSSFFDQAREIDATSSVQPNTLICVSKPKPIDQDYEWRFWLGRDGVHTSSPYSWNTDTSLPPAPPAVIAMADEVAEFCQDETSQLPDHIFTADFCLSDGKPRLVEVNSASCSGLYQADLDKALNGIRRAVQYHLGCDIDAPNAVLFEQTH